MRRTIFEAIGTRWEIQVRDIFREEDWQTVQKQMHERIEKFDQTYSRFRSDSLVNVMAQQGGRFELPEDGYPLLQFYEKLYEITAGKVTPLIGRTLEEAGYDAEYSLAGKPMHRPPEWQEIISYTPATIDLKQPALLDLGAAGKGYLVDIVANIMEASGLQSFTINAGGDILHRSSAQEALAVGLENPHDVSEVIGVVQLGNQSLCASAGSKRQWGKFHHIIDPEHLTSPQAILSTWVIAADTMTADGLATALFFTLPKRLQQDFAFSYAILNKNMGLAYSPDFPVSLFQAS